MELYEIEKTVKTRKRKGKVECLIKWLGYSPGGGGALILERAMGMCRGHDPLFSGQSPHPSLPIYCQCAALVTSVFNF